VAPCALASDTLENMIKPDLGAQPRMRVAIGVAFLLMIMAAELALSVRQQSQTFDEACHIFAGYRYWKNSDFGINFEHPPLIKLIAAVPLLWLPLRVPTVPNDYFKLLEYGAGREFLYSNDADSLLWRARIASAVVTLGLALTVFFVGHSMWGAGPALLGLTLFAFEPNILAHGALVTTDIGVTLGLFLSVGSFYLYLKKPSALGVVGTGLAAGLCLGAKHSGILIFPMLFLLVLVELLPLRDPATQRFAPDLTKKILRQSASLAAIAAIALLVLWSLYGFRYAARPSGPGVNPPLTEFAKQMGPSSSAIILKIAQWHLIPESYLYGVVNVYSLGDLPTVLFGKYYETAQWFYFPSIFVIKSSLAFLLLCSLVPFSTALWRKEVRREVLCLLIPPAFYLSMAMFSAVNYGVRHLLPIYPFLIVLAALGAWNLGQRHRALAALVAFLVVFHVVSSVRAFPNYIPYANELWGGPRNVHRVLADSNVDWGQGLKAMKAYIDQRHIKECWFAYLGALPVDVSYYGIPCKGLPTSFANLIQLPMPVVPPQVDGPVFISATELAGTYWRADWTNPYLPFQQTLPSALIADSILVYDGKIDVSEVSALTHENRSMQLLRARKLDQALAEAQTAVEIAPNRPAAHAARSTILAASGRTAEAGEEIARARMIAEAIVAAR
jgi:4-amino-4-deoxy-L-arabinose transferase-like glycosyltransferase